MIKVCHVFTTYRPRYLNRQLHSQLENENNERTEITIDLTLITNFDSYCMWNYNSFL